MHHPNLFLETMHELVEEHGKGWKFHSNPAKLYGQGERDNILCSLTTPDYLAHFEVQQMPGCCAVLIIHHISTNPHLQRHVDAALSEIERGAYDAGFGSVLMAKVVNTPWRIIDGEDQWKVELWIKCLERNWVPSDAFKNAKSGNWVIYLYKNLKQEVKREGLAFPEPPHRVLDEWKDLR